MTENLASLIVEYREDQSKIRQVQEEQLARFDELTKLKDKKINEWQQKVSHDKNKQDIFLKKLAQVTAVVRDYTDWYTKHNDQLRLLYDAATDFGSKNSDLKRLLAERIRDETRIMLLDDIPRLLEVMSRLEDAIQLFARFVSE